MTRSILSRPVAPAASIPGIAAALVCLLTSFAAAAQGADRSVHHDLRVRLYPDAHRIEAEDTLILPEGFAEEGRVRFLLHGGLALSCSSDAFVLHRLDSEGGPVAGDRVTGNDREGEGGMEGARDSINATVLKVALVRYELRPAGDGDWPEGEAAIHLAYEGTIYHPISSQSEEYARSFSETPGIISEEGSVLSAGTYWFPSFGDELVTFRLAVELPAGRDGISQGRRVEHVERDGLRRVVWESLEPMDDIYLIESSFTEYQRAAGKVEAFAFLREPDPGLASRYLDATVRYIQMYSDLIGPYPYAKFALVENFWETGYGMPSFTLLGPKVIRFPFILHTSYPHEILHNWWGNGVFVAYEKGNWCEGLTAYLADHLLKEVKGQGVEYRRDTLKKYVSFVLKNRDFPLRNFRSRHDAATEAVGYGKSLMLYHMLRMRLGDERFVQGLREFYRSFGFKRAAFEDLEAVFSRVAKADLAPFFDQWVDRSGAPDIRLDGCVCAFDPGRGGSLRIKVRQFQQEEPFAVRIPVAVHLEGEEYARIHTIEMEGREAALDVDVDRPVTFVELDPCFDVFRRLHREETPPTLGQAFGAEQVLIILPGEAEDAMRSAWKALAAAWGAGKGDRIQMKSDHEVEALPADRSVWIFGKENRWRPSPVEELADYGASLEGDLFTFGGESLPFKDHVAVVALRHPEAPDLVHCWVCADLPESLPGLGRKLPHYGKYSYLAFEGGEPTNVAKGQWPLTRSPMKVVPGPEGPGAWRCKLPERNALAEPPPEVDRTRLQRHVAFLADDRLQGRGLGTRELDEAADYVARCFEEYGLKPGGEMASYFQAWQDEAVGSESRPAVLKNVIGMLPGTDEQIRDDWLVVGAHYDHLGIGWPDVHAGDEGKIHNGADDNASGVAVLLEVARMMCGGTPPDRTIVFAAFTGEEAGLRGSRRFLDLAASRPAGGVFAMVNLDSLGRLEGRKLSAFGTDSAREWKYILMWAGLTTGFEAQEIPRDPGTGDQVAFIQRGIPAIHLFAGIHEDYHRPTDDVEKIDFEGMVRITEFTKEIVGYLADRKEPLQAEAGGPGAGGHPGGTAGGGASGGPPGGTAGGSERQASLGTMPDFTFDGEGAQVASVRAGSPAEKAGIVPGDIIIGLNDLAVKDLRSYSQALKRFKPGDKVLVHVLREGKKETLEAVLEAR